MHGALGTTGTSAGAAGVGASAPGAVAAKEAGSDAFVAEATTARRVEVGGGDVYVWRTDTNPRSCDATPIDRDSFKRDHIYGKVAEYCSNHRVQLLHLELELIVE